MRRLTTFVVAFATLASSVTANDCLTDASLATVERAGCLEAEGKALEAEMVDTYLASKATNEQSDPPWDARLNDALQQSQIDFENYRDSQCAFEATQVQGGTALGIVNLACRNALTRERISLLTTLAGAN